MKYRMVQAYFPIELIKWDSPCIFSMANRPGRLPVGKSHIFGPKVWDSILKHPLSPEGTFTTMSVLPQPCFGFVILVHYYSWSILVPVEVLRPKKGPCSQ